MTETHSDERVIERERERERLIKFKSIHTSPWSETSKLSLVVLEKKSPKIITRDTGLSKNII